MIAPRTPPRVRCLFLKCFIHRGVAQPGSAPPWGGGGRRFKSSRPDQFASLRIQLHSQILGRSSMICLFGGANVHGTFATSPPHPCRGNRIFGQPSSLTAGVRRCRALPSRPTNIACRPWRSARNLEQPRLIHPCMGVHRHGHTLSVSVKSPVHPRPDQSNLRYVPSCASS